MDYISLQDHNSPIMGLYENITQTSRGEIGFITAKFKEKMTCFCSLPLALKKTHAAQV
jgi:hypothetical protein